MTELATQTLQQAAREISAALAEARTALEAYAEQPANSALLERCAFELHQVQGVLRVLEIYGAALLAEEMEQVARYLIGTREERKNQAEALDALMRAMVQLPGYLERVLGGGRDLALVLLPLLNDLRAVRGCALLSEGTLLLLNLKSDRQAQPAAPAPGEPPLIAGAVGAAPAAALPGRPARLDPRRAAGAEPRRCWPRSPTRLEQVATQQPVFQLWWVVGALLEALRESGLESSVSVKRLLGQADREIKPALRTGRGALRAVAADRAAQQPALLRRARHHRRAARGRGARLVPARRAAAGRRQVEQERENLSAPSVKLMQTVAAAIREDLTRVKDVLDIFVRRGGGQVEELTPQIELLRKIGDTLGVLGLGELRARVQEAHRAPRGDRRPGAPQPTRRRWCRSPRR